jgi:hypothetical protein
MVQIRKQQERSFLAAAAINSIPDIAIGIIGSAFIDGGIIAFLAIYFGLQAVYFVLWLKRVVWGWLLYWLRTRKELEAHLENYLYQQRFPRPPEFVGGIEDYLGGVADDAKVHPQVRVKAAVELGVLTGIRAAGNYLYTMQLSLAFEKALQQYERRFPPRQIEHD